MQRVFFYWTTRDVSSFRMFSDVMVELYEQDTEKRLEVRNFLTTIEESEVGTVLLNLAANQIHKQTEMDIRLGHHSRAPLSIGRPDWETEFDRVLTTTRQLGLSEAGIFLCGPSAMALQVCSTATKVSNKGGGKLVFSKETF